MEKIKSFIMKLKRACKSAFEVLKEDSNPMPKYSVSFASNGAGGTAYYVSFPDHYGKGDCVFISGGHYSLLFNKNPKYAKCYCSMDEAAKAIWARDVEEDEAKKKAQRKQERRTSWETIFKFK